MADYVSLARVKATAHVETNSDDALLADLITAASRVVDFLVTGRQEAEDYFTLATLADEVLFSGVVDQNGHIHCWPHKAKVNSVSAFSWRISPLHEWTPVDSERILLPGGNKVTAWGASDERPSSLLVKVSYNGGFATEPDDMPSNLQELAALLAVRFYREGEGGMNDVIGIAELGTLQYTRALPQRAQYLLSRLRRLVPW